MASALLQLLLPTECAGCGSPGAAQPLCAACTQDLPRTLWPLTPTPDALASAWYATTYDEALGAAIRRAKYRPDPATMRSIALHIAECARGRLPEVDGVVAVPQRPLKTLQRGYDPVALLAAVVAEALDRPVVPALGRRRAPAQAGMDVRARRRNAGRAFRSRLDLNGERLLLVDDVVTSGSTVQVCARELRLAGALSVHLIAVCSAGQLAPA